LLLPGSHRDKKTINISMMIHYSINMPYDSGIHIKRKEGFDYSQHGIKRNEELDDFIDKLCDILSFEEPFGGICVDPPPSFFHEPDEVLKKVEAIVTERNNLRKEIEDVKRQHESEINNLRKEFNERISKLENDKNQEIFTLKEILGKSDSEYIIRRDLAQRKNPITNKIEDFVFPLNFDKEKVHNLRTSDKGPDLCYFNYYYTGDFPDGKYTEYGMPFSLFDSLCKKADETKHKIFDIRKLQNEEDIKNYILSKGGNLRGKYPVKVIAFIYRTRGKSFEIHDFNKYCKFQVNRESRGQYIKKLIEWGLIKPTENPRVYQNSI
jgi:hypothetical protein